MDNVDLKFIKKHYGENFARLCRESFPTILEKEGQLKDIIFAHFEPNKSLYDDVLVALNDFRTFVNSCAMSDEKKDLFVSGKTPEELLFQSGYVLYPECKSEREIQAFRKYYANGEELCTFRGGRLETNRVWFAVKKDVARIKRKDFKNPERQDEYGTSVISIQFTKSEPSALSIKNRYNHAVVNCDATFSNNLENITLGLTDAFARVYGLDIDHTKANFELSGYVSVHGKNYKYNFEDDNVYYCGNNVIVDNFDVRRFDKSRYVVFDNYILDKKFRQIRTYQDYKKYAKERNAQIEDLNGDLPETGDAFVSSIGEIAKVREETVGGEKRIVFTPQKGEDVVLTLDDHNQITSFVNCNARVIGDAFLTFSKNIQSLVLPNVEEIKSYALYSNQSLQFLYAPKVRTIGECFIINDSSLRLVNLPSAEEVARCFLGYNKGAELINMPLLKSADVSFVRSGGQVCFANLPSLVSLGECSFDEASGLKAVYAPCLENVGDNLFYRSSKVEAVCAPRVSTFGRESLDSIKNQTEVRLESGESEREIFGDYLKDFEKRIQEWEQMRVDVLSKFGLVGRVAEFKGGQNCDDSALKNMANCTNLSDDVKSVMDEDLIKNTTNSNENGASFVNHEVGFEQ